METKKMDKIKIEDLEVYAYHGVYPEENEKGQHFYINAVLYTDTRKAGLEDKLELSTHYGEVCHYMKNHLTEHTFRLLEAVAETLAEGILLQFPLIHGLTLEIRKPEAPIGLPFSSVSVEIERGWNTCYIAFGSNLGEREQQIEQALGVLRRHPSIRAGKVSDIYTTSPYGGVEQPDFLNGVIEIDTLLPPRELLDFLHQVEAEAGRERTVHWGPRTLDLDIIFYGKEVYEDEALILPHPDMQNRDFVLRPMLQLAPGFRHPILKKTIKELWEEWTHH